MQVKQKLNIAQHADRPKEMGDVGTSPGEGGGEVPLHSMKAKAGAVLKKTRWW